MSKRQKIWSDFRSGVRRSNWPGPSRWPQFSPLPESLRPAEKRQQKKENQGERWARGTSLSKAKVFEKGSKDKGKEGIGPDSLSSGWVVMHLRSEQASEQASKQANKQASKRLHGKYANLGRPRKRNTQSKPKTSEYTISGAASGMPQRARISICQITVIAGKSIQRDERMMNWTSTAQNV